MWTESKASIFILAEMCGNRFFEALMKSLLGLTKKVVEAVNPDPDYVHPRGMHRSVVVAVVTGNAEIAAEAMKNTHTIDFGENFIKWRGLTEKEIHSLDFRAIASSPPSHLLDIIRFFFRPFLRDRKKYKLL